MSEHLQGDIPLLQTATDYQTGIAGYPATVADLFGDTTFLLGKLETIETVSNSIRLRTEVIKQERLLDSLMYISDFYDLREHVDGLIGRIGIGSNEVRKSSGYVEQSSIAVDSVLHGVARPVHFKTRELTGPKQTRPVISTIEIVAANPVTDTNDGNSKNKKDYEMIGFFPDGLMASASGNIGRSTLQLYRSVIAAENSLS